MIAHSQRKKKSGFVCVRRRSLERDRVSQLRNDLLFPHCGDVHFSQDLLPVLQAFGRLIILLDSRSDDVQSGFVIDGVLAVLRGPSTVGFFIGDDLFARQKSGALRRRVSSWVLPQVCCK